MLFGITSIRNLRYFYINFIPSRSIYFKSAPAVSMMVLPRGVRVAFIACSLFISPMSTATVCDEVIRRAVVVGATGATGREVVRELLHNNWQVTTVSRRNFSFDEFKPKESKLTQLQSDFSNTNELINLWTNHDALFNCLGTTRGQAGSAEAFVDVEVELTKKVVNIAKEAKIRHVSVVSAQGANRHMWVPTTLIHPMLYIRTMGEKQQAVIDKEFPSVTIFNPGMLNRLVSDRAWEVWLHGLIPSLSLRVDTLAQAMRRDAEKQLHALDTLEAGDANAPAARVTFVSGNVDIAAQVPKR